jgi:hypothetical protein
VGKTINHPPAPVITFQSWLVKMALFYPHFLEFDKSSDAWEVHPVQVALDPWRTLFNERLGYSVSSYPTTMDDNG